jgi:hypothetical protein
VYALATTLYELLAGVLPFSIATEGADLAMLFKHAYEKPVPLRDVAPRMPDPVAADHHRGRRGGGHLVVILAVFLLPKMFKVYNSPAGLGPRPGLRPATAQLR